MDVVAGAYESLVTRRLARLLEETTLEAAYTRVPDAAAPDVLARHIAEAVRKRLTDMPVADRASYVNSLLSLGPGDDLDLVDKVEQLTELREPGLGARWPQGRPATPLSDVALLTNSRGEPNLGAELRQEMGSADHVDLLCAFVRWHGLRVLEEPLQALKDRGIRLRVVTTTYRGATERRALDELVRRFGAQVKIRYDAQTTRLHAKAWLFRRESGFDTGYVGSSNLSKSALVDGLEWNVRISSEATPTLVRKFEATFDTYWNDPGFLDYDPDRDAELLDRALAVENGSSSSGAVVSISGLEVTARPHQELILEALDVERLAHDRHRNLVIAATGTGKTVVAALDFRRLRAQWLEREGREPRLLFVAHRKEILEQALRTYREVLSDGVFGELLLGGSRPTRWSHVFASIQSLSPEVLAELDPDHFDVVVVDEFHHAEARSYQRLLDRLQPDELLGLTATPERGDGVDVRSFFDSGEAAYELPLWSALEADLLCPFHYFGVADGTDLRGVDYRRGAYDVAGLDGVYTGNDARTRIVLSALRDRVTDVGRMRALGFCVSVAHAEYMARKFAEAGIPSAAISGETPTVERERAFALLRSGDLRCLFAVDLFNEGLDLPDVDTLLMLRPTQSSTVFLQQLGRGLRRAPGKAVLTVLDFIGHHRAEFRHELRYRALTGTTREQLQRDVEQGFPYLPAGSQLVLDRVAQQLVLDNVRSSLRSTKKDLVRDVRAAAVDGRAPDLDAFVKSSGRPLSDVYRKGGSYTDLVRASSLPAPEGADGEAALLRRLSALAHVDDRERALLYARMADAEGPRYDELDSRGQALARMLFFALWPNKGDFDSYEAGFAFLRSQPAVAAEVRQLMAGAVERAEHVARPLPSLGHLPVLSHATYRREELLAGLGWATWERSARGNITGVAWSEDEQVDALMINLRKDESSFTPSTMYRDYALSPTLFHWESQNATSETSVSGRRYVSHRAGGSHVVLFTRDAPTDAIGAAPFTCLGTAQYVEHRGERPMAITWELDRAMPPGVVQAASAISA